MTLFINIYAWKRALTQYHLMYLFGTKQVQMEVPTNWKSLHAAREVTDLNGAKVCS